jgi:RND family efflux transporter MFP subunit
MDPEKIAQLKIRETGHTTPRKRRGRKLIGIFLFLFAVALILSVMYEQGMLSSAVTVQLTPVAWVYPSQAITDFNASGYVVAQRRASVASKGTGRLEHLAVKEGSRVKKGDLIASLENDDLKAERAQTAGQLAAARADLARSEADLRIAERNWNRRRELFAANAVARADYENTQDQYEKAKAAVAAAGANIKALQAAVERTSILIDYTEIRAPFDGVVLTKDADVGEVVAPFASALKAKAAVVTMADLSSLMVEADVAESFLSKAHEGQPCEIQLDSLPDSRFPGKVNTIVPTADRTRGTVLVKVELDKLDPRILPEMSARVAFLSRPLTDRESRPFLAVHRDALVERNGGRGVFEAKDDRAVWVPLSKAEEIGDYAVPSPSLPAGRKVIMKPPSNLKNGDRIQVPE